MKEAVQVTVHTKEFCQPCKATVRKLDQLGVEYVSVAADPDVLAAKGFTSAPVVEVDLGDRASWSWSGHRPSQLERLAALLPS